VTINPAHTSNQKELHDLLLGTVSPRPIALASTVDLQGNINLSPFSFFNIFSTRPAVLVFSPSRRQRDNTTKHTLENLLDTKEVVINTVNYAMVEQVSLASADFSKGVNEFVKAGLTELKSEYVKPPRVKESPASFECRVLEIKSLGREGGAGNLAICEVILIHVRDDVFTESGKVDPRKVDSVARMGEDYYCHVMADSIFELPRPPAADVIGFDRLPLEIRNSSVLTGNNLARLATVAALPTDREVSAFVENYQHDISQNQVEDKTMAIHKQAQAFLERGEIKKAWLLLLSTKHSALWS
jgi:flavin reductase (DIM6/NTAB) family NADH-FMN oxidoreductase RutF